MAVIRTLDGRNLHFEEAGSGPPLLCHPGGPGMSARYFDRLPDLAAERTVLLLDPRGNGRSDRPADPTAYDLSDHADDVEAVREELGLDRLDVLGHSFGGFVAMAWAAAHPERVGRLVLANTAARFTADIRRARGAIVDSYAGELWYDDARAALEAHEAGRYESDAELEALFARNVPFLFARFDDDARAVAALLVEGGRNADVLRHFNERIAPGMDLRPGLARVDAPVLVITGERDFFAESTAFEIAAALPKARLVVLPGAGHFAFAESANRKAWARAILDFLAES